MHPIKRPEFRITFDPNMSSMAVRLVVAATLNEFETYVFNCNWLNGGIRMNPNHVRSYKIFGWNPCFIPNTKQNVLLRKMMETIDCISISASQSRRGKRVIVRIHLKKGNETLPPFVWWYLVRSPDRDPELRFERQAEGPS